MSSGVAMGEVCTMICEMDSLEGGYQKRDIAVCDVPGSAEGEELEDGESCDSEGVVTISRGVGRGEQISQMVSAVQVGPAREVRRATLRVTRRPKKVGGIRRELPDDVVKEVGGRCPWVVGRVESMMACAFAVRVDGKGRRGMRAPNNTAKLTSKR